MHPVKNNPPSHLEDLPNIGKSIVADLRAIGIATPRELAGRDPLTNFLELSGAIGRRHDPCVLYVLLAARHFLESGEARRWWTFTAEGKELLATLRGRPK